MNARDVATKAQTARSSTDNSGAFDRMVQVGIISYGLVHLIIAWIALQLAFGDRKGQASTDGALRQMAQTPVGGVLLYVVAAGFAALVVWQLAEAFAGHHDEEGNKRVGKRLGSGLKAVLFGLLGWSALQIAMGSGSGGGGTDSTTAKLMSMPAGPLLVGIVGVGIAAYGLWEVYKGLSESFMKKLESSGHTGDTGKAFVILGKTGYVSKGVALFIVAGLFIWAAISHDPKKSGGLDQALQTVLEQPFGPVMLVVLAAGIACYGVFCFAWARHLKR